MERRGFLRLLGGAAVASTNPVRFFAPVGGWQPKPIRGTYGGVSRTVYPGHFSTPHLNATGAALTPAMARMVCEQMTSAWKNTGFYLVG